MGGFTYYYLPSSYSYWKLHLFIIRLHPIILENSLINPRPKCGRKSFYQHENTNSQGDRWCLLNRIQAMCVSSHVFILAKTQHWREVCVRHDDAPMGVGLLGYWSDMFICRDTHILKTHTHTYTQTPGQRLPIWGSDRLHHASVTHLQMDSHTLTKCTQKATNHRVEGRNEKYVC